MLYAFLFHFKALLATHGKDGFYGFNGEPPQVMTNLALGKPLFDINVTLTSLHTVKEQAFLSMAVLTRNPFAEKHPYLFAVFSK